MHQQRRQNQTKKLLVCHIRLWYSRMLGGRDVGVGVEPPVKERRTKIQYN